MTTHTSCIPAANYNAIITPKGYIITNATGVDMTRTRMLIELANEISELGYIAVLFNIPLKSGDIPQE